MNIFCCFSLSPLRVSKRETTIAVAIVGRKAIQKRSHEPFNEADIKNEENRLRERTFTNTKSKER